MIGARTAFRGEFLDYVADPRDSGSGAVRYRPDAVVIVNDGRIERVGPAAELLASESDPPPVVDYRGKIVMPGFVDTHVHFPQMEVVASYGEQLLDWLARYTYPAEARFADAPYAQARAELFCDELLRNGTTTALAFATVHPASVDALFAAAERRDMRLATGRVLMDRNCPEALRDDTEAAFEESVALVERWHGRGRLTYAVTPRYAGTSTPRQLELSGRLMERFPDLHLQSHVAESLAEASYVLGLFPGYRSYLDIYDRFGLIRPGAVYAHCIHLDAQDRIRMAACGATMAFCPTSNLFLGSGLFDLAAADESGARVALATDVGAGTSLSMLRTLGEAYKVLQLRGQSLSAHRAFYFATLGGAKALRADASIGSFDPGKEADFVVLDWAPTAMMAQRMERAQTLEERLFALMTLGDDRNVHAVHVAGRCVSPESA